MRYGFKLSGYSLRGAEDNDLEFGLAPGDRKLQVLEAAPVNTSPSKQGRGMGGFGVNPMAAIMDSYESAARTYSYKVDVEAVVEE